MQYVYDSDLKSDIILIEEEIHLKTNNECARKILFEVENIPYGETLTVAKLQERISEFSIEDVLGIVFI